MHRLETALARFAEAAPALVSRSELLRRIDTKFVVTSATAALLLPGLAGAYATLRVPSGAVATYHNLYYDTSDLRCYHDHRRGRRIRHKVRVRHYPDRAVSFLEVKTKRNELVTEKRRLDLAYQHEQLGARELDFLRAPLGDMSRELRPQMRIDFNRVSLLGLGGDERVTLDLDLVVTRADGSREDAGDVVVIEVKQPAYSGRTPAMRAFLGARLRPRPVSKYVNAVRGGPLIP